MAKRPKHVEKYNKHIKGVVVNSIFFYLILYEGWNFNSGNYLFTTDTK